MTAIHNGTHQQWNYLELVDRANGEVERIRLDDPDSAESVKSAAVRRVKLETLLTLDDLAKIVSRTIPELRAGVGPLSLKRWILEGKRGVYLDGIHTPGEGWKSSVEAVQRFVADVNATT